MGYDWRSLEPPVLLVLRRGGVVYAERAGPGDRDRIIGFYESLSLDSVYMRFLHVVRDFSRYVDMVLGDLNKYGAVIVAYSSPAKEKVVAVAEVFSKEGYVGELAVTVAEDSRGRGIGTAMAILAALEAYRRGVRIIEAYIARDNSPAIAIARKMGLRLRYVGGDTCKAEADVEQAYRAAWKVFQSIVAEAKPFRGKGGR